MKIVVAGGGGFIGKRLCGALSGEGYDIVILSRSRQGAFDGARYLRWDPSEGARWADAVGAADAVINLAGESIADGRWSEPRKRVLVESRIASTRAIVAGLNRLTPKPKIFVNASAVGYYGPRGDETIDEDSRPGSDFLAELCRQWENECLDAERQGVRTVKIRIGIVLGHGGGAIAKMLLPFKLGLGGPLGSGDQWMSWVHIDDLAGLVLFLIDHPTASGPINATAPNPVTNREFAKTLGAVLRRPAFLPAPAFALRLALGEMADMLLTGQKVLPKKAQALSYSFRHSQLKEALQSLFL
ncbi:MAG: TIGR01777 family protein [Elusimicrobia bacterium]|nr:TIGR01777 family protein [Elusimicrobiota bacterium]